MKKHSVYIVLIVFIISGCKVMYMPNALNVPLFSERNEVKANISFNDYQFAYAVTNHIGLMVNGYARGSEFSTSSNSLEYNYTANRYMAEGGIGYFNSLSDGFVFETYAGGGIGNITYNEIESGSSNNTHYKYSANFNKFFVQPGLGYINDNVDIAFSARIVRLNFYNPYTENYSQQMLIDEDIYGLDRTTYYFVEPTMTFRVGYKWAKFQTQFIYSNKINADPLNYQRFSIKLGVHIDISPRFKNKD